MVRLLHRSLIGGKAEGLDILVRIIQYGMIMGADIRKIVVYLFRSFLQCAGQLAGGIFGAFGALGVNDVGHRLRGGEGKPSVEKGSPGKLPRQGLACAQGEALVQQRAQHDRRAVALKFHRILAGIAVARAADRAEAEIQKRPLPVMQPAVDKRARRA